MATDACDAASPPRTVNPLPSATTAGRESATGSCHAATPASRDCGPLVETTALPEPPAVRVDAADVVVVVDEVAEVDEDEPPLDSE